MYVCVYVARQGDGCSRLLHVRQQLLHGHERWQWV